ncbi:MAG: damage-inducible protein DinB [Flavobacteriaceae bacterium]|nr:damage-inducible protein DinB [Flavobacteriaceae bacterium]|tara:strand:- start:252 stop:698 length:447 start_codon:yes stop_codon:yes gene_type:complete
MMKEFFKDIFDYHHHFNQKILQQLQSYSSNLSERTQPLFSHIINAHQIWNARVANTKELGVHQLHSFSECKNLDLLNYQKTLTIINERDLDETVSYQNSKGMSFTNTLQDILFHIANHTTHHRGQIISDLRASGVAPIATDYIFFKRK